MKPGQWPSPSRPPDAHHLELRRDLSPQCHNLAALNEDGAHLRRISKPVAARSEKYRIQIVLYHVLYYLLRLQVLYPPASQSTPFLFLVLPASCNIHMP